MTYEELSIKAGLSVSYLEGLESISQMKGIIVK